VSGKRLYEQEDIAAKTETLQNEGFAGNLVFYCKHIHKTCLKIACLFRMWGWLEHSEYDHAGFVL